MKASEAALLLIQFCVNFFRPFLLARMPKRQRADGRVRRPADDAPVASKELGELSFDELMSSTIDAEVAAQAQVPTQAKPKTKSRRPVTKGDAAVSRPSATGKPAAVPRKRAAADESSEEEEDAEAALERHQREMARLRKADPAFFQFLKQSDPALLEFGGVDSDDAEEDEEADEEGGLAGTVWQCIVPKATTTFSPYRSRCSLGGGGRC